MKILVIGSGAREHAIAWKCVQSELTTRVYCAPGNGGTGGLARNIPVQADDVAGLVRFAKKERIGLAILGNDASVAAGAGDALRDAGFPVFGPSRGPGRIESSKAFAKELMGRAAIPTAGYGVFTEAGPALDFARRHRGRVAVKADGLALGKGVVVCGSLEEAGGAIEAMLVKKTFGRAGSTVVVEERLEGPELSVFGVTDGSHVVPLAPARDYKRAREGDEGPNTGGMGAYSPPRGVDDATVAEAVKTILEPAVRELARQGLEYRGVLYAGLMLTNGGLQVILPRLQSDAVSLMLTAARGDLSSLPPLHWSPRSAVGVVVASPGYPEAYETGFPITGLATIPAGTLIFHAGTRFQAGRGLVTSGGRVVTAVGLGADAHEARLSALAGAVRVRFPGAYFRSDIAQEAELG